MCTTFLAYKIVNYLQKEMVEFLDYPRLIRFNPNIPWKTRGNGAVSITISTNKPKQIKEKIKHLVKKYSDVQGGANPGLIFYQKETIPKNFIKFSELALWQLISRQYAKKFVSKNKLDFFFLGNGQGLVGALGAISYKFSDLTYELLSYRKKSHVRKKREINKNDVKIMQEKTFPQTFNSYDNKTGNVLITPHGPDPVFYGIRGENPHTIIDASKMIRIEEKLDGYLVFKSNQGTSDHLKNQIDISKLKPYTSGTITGVVSSTPQIHLGGYVTFFILVNDKNVQCAVYKPTKITRMAQELIRGDRIRVGGGIRKASKHHHRILNIEFIQILQLAKNIQFVNPLCTNCDKRMKSKGKGQGFQCVRCKSKFNSKTIQEIPRKITRKQYTPVVSSHRHLTRPVQRIGIKNKEYPFDSSVPWIHVYKN